ncbi:MAG: DUF4292 domain-containing protein [Gilvibacter sp.]
MKTLYRPILRFKLPILMVLFVLLSTSCGTRKLEQGTTAATNSVRVKQLISSHNEQYPSFNTLAARVNVDYEDEKTSQNITVSLRMEKDKAIWIKASLIGITLSKVLITPDRVQYYERLGNTYFDGDFALISDWLGTDIDFDKAQSILLGQSIFSLTQTNYTSSVKNNEYLLNPVREIPLFLHFLTMRPDTYKIGSAGIDQPSKNRQLRMYYPEYQKIEGQVFPKKVVIKASENQDITSIEMEFRNIDLNVPISFPFSIPNGLDEIRINK